MVRGIGLHRMAVAERNGVDGVHAINGVLHGTWRTARQRDAGHAIRATELRSCE
jgi:hypothetical protein